MTDSGDRLAGLDERTDEGDGFGLQAQRVRADDASRQYQRVIIRAGSLFQRAIDRDPVALVMMVEALNRARLVRNNMHLGAFLFQSFHRRGQLHLLEPIGRQDGD